MKKCMKSIAVTGLLTIILGTGCSNSLSSNKNEPVIGFVAYEFNNTWITELKNEMYKVSNGKARVDIWNGNNIQTVENDKISLFINRKVDVLDINPVDVNAAGQIIEKCKKANIPTVFVNRQPKKEDVEKWNKVYYVGAKAEQSGTIQGQMLVNYFKGHPTQDGTIRYIMLKGEMRNQDAEKRTQYSIKALEDSGFKVQKVAEDTAMWDRTKAQEKMTSFISSYGPNFDCVIANNDDMALGAVDALKAAGYFNGGKYVPVVGVDATAPAVKAVEDGTLFGTVLNDAAKQGDAAFDLSYILSKGKIPDESNFKYKITDGKYIWIDYKMITKENVQDAK
ncbi:MULTISPECIES: galactose ABC transporter substrate-binding protein [Clostridium]|uniref:D-galactose/methyl-galactoside binding periplasmic protein MglB n=2 Tax=Clostridium TaxID=1485 RepID=A0A166TET0_9CLOT|nr:MULTISPECIES: galactose ABC transporter substrate-binding protein [Clostridium]AGY77192.1 galactose ABC transporter substrate-binding protein [Clostridium autoethanogenum DSM 10061]ALU37335.1 Periplasmic binding protein domain-containing protein [Clostridium autoethanogenum DSM 10061]OAA93591.1 D-galactose-binding periplasmic protein precursor [Clostridium coskatii]OBR94434.1 D-galactose-binding periplasmic protein precursor [Clostridium coskatii]OVY50097.1 D-galactose-binding periplasmic p